MFDGTRLRDLIASRELSQSELARRIGVSQTTIAKLVSGRGYGSKHLHKIARELGTTPAYLSGETDDPKSDAPALPDLDHEEVAWIGYWRALDSESRKAVVQVVRLLAGGGGQGGGRSSGVANV